MPLLAVLVSGVSTLPPEPKSILVFATLQNIIFYPFSFCIIFWRIIGIERSIFTNSVSFSIYL